MDGKPIIVSDDCSYIQHSLKDMDKLIEAINRLTAALGTDEPGASDD